MEEILAILLTNPEIITTVLSGAKQGFLFINHVVSDWWDNKVCKKNRKATIYETFKQTYNLLWKDEQLLVQELITGSGIAQRPMNEFYIEGSWGLRSKMFLCLARYSWIEWVTLQEEISEYNKPIHVSRELGYYEFKLRPEYKQLWRKLYKKMLKEKKRLEK